MRDALELESRGVPTAAIIAEPLVSTAESTKRLLGATTYEYCVMGRPYSGMSPEETQDQARKLAPRIHELLTRPQ